MAKKGRDRTSFADNVTGALYAQRKLSPDERPGYFGRAVKSLFSYLKNALYNWLGLSNPAAKYVAKKAYQVTHPKGKRRKKGAADSTTSNVAAPSKPSGVFSNLLNYVSDAVQSWVGDESDEDSRQALVLNEADTYLQKQMEALESRVKPLMAERMSIEKRIKTAKSQKIDISPNDLKRREALLDEIDALYLKKVNLCPEMVREHAARRVDLFFLLMVAVYKKNLYFDENAKKGTNKQHGKGSNRLGTAGCHSSMVTNVHVTLAKTVRNATRQTSLFNQIWDTVSGWFSEARPQGLTAQEAANFMEGTFLAEALNMTVELPEIVNNFDSYLEGSYRKSYATRAALGILNRVSVGKLNPAEGLNEFARVLDLCFSSSEYRHGLVKEGMRSLSATVLYPKAFDRARELEQEGTFRVFNKQKKTVLPSYLSMQLKLHNMDTSDVMLSYISDRPIVRRYLALQREILTSTYDKDSTSTTKPSRSKKSVKVAKQPAASNSSLTL